MSPHVAIYILIGSLLVGFAVIVGLAAKFGNGAVRNIACIVMTGWQDFLDSLNSDGAHILILAIMVWLGMVGMKIMIPKADDLFVGAFTALLILLKTAGSNKTRRDRPAPPSEVPEVPAPPAPEVPTIQP